jgi:hypothetical protein
MKNYSLIPCDCIGKRFFAADCRSDLWRPVPLSFLRKVFQRLGLSPDFHLVCLDRNLGVAISLYLSVSFPLLSILWSKGKLIGSAVLLYFHGVALDSSLTGSQKREIVRGVMIPMLSTPA